MANSIAAPYRNDGNDLALSLIPQKARRILDVGCGAGDNARRLKLERKDVEIVGITHSHEEAEIAKPFLDDVIVANIEALTPEFLQGPFDILLFSHVLEHLRDPAEVVQSFLKILNPGGYVLIVVPNTLNWRSRLKLACGRFDYADHGIFDRTHLRFFTYESAPRELVFPNPHLVLEVQEARGAAPLGPLRRWILPSSIRRKIDEMAVRLAPNLFSQEVAMLARLV